MPEHEAEERRMKEKTRNYISVEHNMSEGNAFWFVSEGAKSQSPGAEIF